MTEPTTGTYPDAIRSLVSCARLSGERSRQLAEALATIERVRGLLSVESPRKFDGLGNYQGCVSGAEHRSVGPHRAWCHQCGEWCYPDFACGCCDPRIEPSDLRTALDGTSE